MSYVGGGHCRTAVPVTGVVTAHEGPAQFAVLSVDSRNVGVLAGAGLVEGRGAVRPRGELGRRAVEVWYQWGEGSVSSEAGAGRGRDVAVRSRALLGRQERGMLGGETSGAVGGHRQVRVLVVITGMEGFAWGTNRKSQERVFQQGDSGAQLKYLLKCMGKW